MIVMKHYGAEKWCAPCRALRPIIQEIVSKNPSVTYQYIDVDTYPDEAKANGIRSIPVVVIQKNGVETNRFVGIQPKSVYENAII